jgi:hypothetical protein
MVREAEDAWLHPTRVEIVAQESFRGKKGVSLKRGVEPVKSKYPGELEVSTGRELTKQRRIRFSVD